MSVKRVSCRILRVALWASLCASAPQAMADSLWSNIMAPRRIEADPDKKYELKQDNGPWSIMACSFTGPDAAKQAHDLVLELRRRNKLEAYVYEHDFALEDPNQSALSATASPYRHQYRQFAQQPNQYKDGAIKEIAVMVGNYSAIDDPEAQATLDKIKSLEPECLQHKEQASQSDPLTVLRKTQDDIWKNIQTSREEIGKHLRTGCVLQGPKHLGPLSHGLITRNPLLPEDYFVQPGLDDFVIKLNEGLDNSLLKCKAKYTVQVAHFTGEIIIERQRVVDIESGRAEGPEKKQTLADAARKAHELTIALRVKGYEAYEFHDRYCSLVTVGSFDTVGTPRPDGKTEINPEIYKIMERFKAKQPAGAAQAGYIQVQTLVGICFDAQPIPVEVPKRSIPRALGQRLEVAGQ
jgi:hypothetical protein